MIIEQNPVAGLKSELGALDAAMEKLGFVRWQWEYYRATYDYKFEHAASGEDYYLRVNARAIEGKLENPIAVLELQEVYIGRASFPHGVDYASSIPNDVLKAAEQILADLKKSLA